MKAKYSGSFDLIIHIDSTAVSGKSSAQIHWAKSIKSDNKRINYFQAIGLVQT